MENKRIIIQIPNTNIQEKKYTLRVLFEELLGLDINIETSENKDYVLILPNRKEIHINDSFFCNFPDDLSYLTVGAIPERITYASNMFLVENDIPILYGNMDIIIENKKIYCGIDIIGACFFMLSRWPESVLNVKDQYSRFTETESLAYRFGFLQRPIVNEYVEMLWNMIKCLGYNNKRGNREFQVIPTHDVDRIYNKTIGNYLSIFLKNKNWKRFITSCYYSIFKINQIESFEYIFTQSEQLGLQSHFYFLNGGSYRYERYYEIDDPLIYKIMNMISNRGHLVGFHPSFDTFDDSEMWKNEKHKLEQVSKNEIKEGRQHYLCFLNPVTWQIWNDNNMHVDSSMGLSKSIGFRCGTGCEFSVFDIFERKQLSLKERPLLVMDCAISSINTTQSNWDQLLQIKKLCKKYKMPFTILFHNHLFDKTFWNNTRPLYTKLLCEEK